MLTRVVCLFLLSSLSLYVCWSQWVPAQEGDLPSAGRKSRRPTAGLPPPSATTLKLSVNEAVQFALTNAFTVRIAGVNRDIQLREWIVEKAAFDPSVSMGFDFSKNRRPTSSVLDIGSVALQGVQVNPFESQAYNFTIGGRTLIGTQYAIRLQQSKLDQPLAAQTIFGINPQEQASASVEFTQPLLRGAWYPYNSARIRISANRQEISEHELQFAAMELIYRVEVAYWQLSFAIKNHESKAKALQTARENLDNITDARKAGARSESDVIVAKSQVALRKVELNEAEVLLKNSRDELLLAINQNGPESLRDRWRLGETLIPFDKVWVVPTSEATTDPFDPDRDRALETAFVRRPDYQGILLQIANQEIAVETASNETLARLDFTGKWEQLGLAEKFEDSFSSLGEGDFYAWTVGAQLSFPLGNREARNRHRQAKDRLRQLQLQRAELENQIVVRVDQSARNATSVFQRVEDLEERASLQEELLKRENEKLELGRTVYYNVSLIENDVLETQALVLRAKAEYEAAKADFYRATGTLLDERGVETEVEQ